MTDPRQLPLALPARRAQGRADFFISPSNALAMAQIDGWTQWPERKCLLLGPQGSGKSHIAQVWATDTGARVHSASSLDAMPPEGGHHVIEDCADAIAQDPTAQERLFHWHNGILSSGGTLLLTGPAPLRSWDITLPDLFSRLDAAPRAVLEPPDDALLMALLVKLFEDRHIVPPADLIPYLASRIERSFSAAAQIVDDLDREALATGRKLGLRLAKERLDKTPDSA